MIKDLAEDHTVLLSTHILPEVSMICDRVMILHEGKIVTEKVLSELSESQTLEELFIESISTEVEVAGG